MANDRIAQTRANSIRNTLGLGQSPIADIFSLVEELGIILFKKPLKSEGVSAVFFKNSQNYIILINSNKTLGHQIFSAAHELSHYFFDKELLGGICSINQKNNEIETKANSFASYFLMPDEGIISIAEKRINKRGKLEIPDIIFIQHYYKVSWQAVLLKLKGLNYLDNIDDFKNIGITDITKKLGYDDSLLRISNDEYVSKKYLELVLKVYNNDDISEKRAAEYLNDVGIELDDIFRYENLNNGGGNYED